MSAKQSLLDMGFTPDKVDEAVSACGENVEQAMEWLLAHADNTVASNSADVAQSSDEKPAAETPLENEIPEGGEEQSETVAEGGEEQSETAAKSIKCDDCRKLFKNSEEVEFHAVKSGHSSFSESTEEKRPLTQEEKQQKLKDLESKLKERRKEKEEEERKEAIEREKKRIQMSKEIADTKRRVEEVEIRRIAEERRREKLEDKLARQRVKEQIERDKLARKEMFGGVPNQTAPPPSTSQPPTPAASAPAPKKEYECTRLQIRLPSGSPLVQEFGAKESLSAVRLWISLNRKDNETPGQSFTLSTTFPRKIFSDEDMDKPLNILGLVPSVVLVVTDI